MLETSGTASRILKELRISIAVAPIHDETPGTSNLIDQQRSQRHADGLAPPRASGTPQ